MENSEIQSIWESFYSNRDEANRQKLVEHYYPYVQSIAKKLAQKLHNKVSDEELASHGVDGLYRAIESFDLRMKNKFETFAYNRIRGSMIDGIRTESWVPRSVRMNHSKLEDAKHNLISESGRDVSDIEALQKLGYKLSAISKNRKRFYPVSVSSIDAFTDEDSEQHKDYNDCLTSQNTASPEGRMLRREFLSKLIGKNMNRLERKIIYLYYYEDLTMEEISDKLSMSESRVSQIHEEAMRRLKLRVKLNPKYFESDVLYRIKKGNYSFPVLEKC